MSAELAQALASDDESAYVQSTDNQVKKSLIIIWRNNILFQT